MGPATDQAHVLDVIDRQYRPSSRLCGRLTWSCVTPTADVYDYKTGSGADAGPQLRARAHGRAAYGVSTVRVAALEVSKERRGRGVRRDTRRVRLSQASRATSQEQITGRRRRRSQAGPALRGAL